MVPGTAVNARIGTDTFTISVMNDSFQMVIVAMTKYNTLVLVNYI